jgi:hypothetical protein
VFLRYLFRSNRWFMNRLGFQTRTLSSLIEWFASDLNFHWKLLKRKAYKHTVRAAREQAVLCGCTWRVLIECQREGARTLPAESGGTRQTQRTPQRAFMACPAPGGSSSLRAALGPLISLSMAELFRLSLFIWRVSREEDGVCA